MPPAEVGKLIAERALAAGVEKVAFDRSGYRYHGRIKALAEAAREGGLQVLIARDTLETAPACGADRSNTTISGQAASKSYNRNRTHEQQRTRSQSRRKRRRLHREAGRRQPRVQDRQGRPPVHLHRADGRRRRRRQDRLRLRQGARSAGRDPEVDGKGPQGDGQRRPQRRHPVARRSRPATAPPASSCSRPPKVPA